MPKPNVGGSEQTVPAHAKVIMFGFPLAYTQVTRTAGQVNKAAQGLFFTFIDEHALEALIKALKEGKIAGAGLDVFEKEPIAQDNPLLKLANVVLTPHIAGSMKSGELQKERATFLARNIEKFIKGKKADNVVDVSLKYAP